MNRARRRRRALGGVGGVSLWGFVVWIERRRATGGPVDCNSQLAASNLQCPGAGGLAPGQSIGSGGLLAQASDDHVECDFLALAQDHNCGARFGFGIGYGAGQVAQIVDLGAIEGQDDIPFG